MKFDAAFALVFTVLCWPLPQERSLGEDSVTNSLGMKLVQIQPGSYLMGSTTAIGTSVPSTR